MVGYPFYNDEIDTDKVYISDVAVLHSKYFFYGFMLAIVTSPGICSADEIAAVGKRNHIPTPAPSPDIPKGNVPTNVRNTIQGLIAVAGCTAAADQCAKVSNQAVKSATEKLSTVSPPSAVAIGGCLLLAGYCAGKLTTKGVDKFLGF